MAVGVKELGVLTEVLAGSQQPIAAYQARLLSLLERAEKGLQTLLAGDLGVPGFRDHPLQLLLTATAMQWRAVDLRR